MIVYFKLTFKPLSFCSNLTFPQTYPRLRDLTRMMFRRSLFPETFESSDTRLPKSLRANDTMTRNEKRTTSTISMKFLNVKRRRSEARVRVIKWLCFSNLPLLKIIQSVSRNSQSGEMIIFGSILTTFVWNEPLCEWGGGLAVSLAKRSCQGKLVQICGTLGTMLKIICCNY